MQAQPTVSTASKQGINKIWLIMGGLLIACCCGAAAVAGAAGLYFSTVAPATSVSVIQVTPQLGWLVTADELNSFSTEIGIVQWQLVEETPGEHRVCHTFSGVSWSANPNQASNCIFQSASGSLENDVTSMFESGQLFEDEVPVTASFDLEGEYALYAGTFPTNAHAVYDLLLLQDGVLYWSSVTVARPAGMSAVDLYEQSPGVIQSFLEKVIRINLERAKQ